MSHYRMFTKNQIKEIAEKANEDKVNLIETNDITSVLDTVKVGDIVKVIKEDDGIVLLCIITFKDEENASIFILDGGDDNIRYAIYTIIDKKWTRTENRQYVDRNYVDENKGTKLYRHHFTATNLQNSYIEIITTFPTLITDGNYESLIVSKNIISGYIKDESYPGEGKLLGIETSAPNIVGHYFNEEDATIESFSFTNIESYFSTDTVTPL